MDLSLAKPPGSLPDSVRCLPAFVRLPATGAVVVVVLLLVPVELFPVKLMAAVAAVMLVFNAEVARLGTFEELLLLALLSGLMPSMLALLFVVLAMVVFFPVLLLVMASLSRSAITYSNPVQHTH